MFCSNGPVSYIKSLAHSQKSWMLCINVFRVLMFSKCLPMFSYSLLSCDFVNIRPVFGECSIVCCFINIFLRWNLCLNPFLQVKYTVLYIHSLIIDKKRLWNYMRQITCHIYLVLCDFGFSVRYSILILKIDLFFKSSYHFYCVQNIFLYKNNVLLSLYIHFTYISIFTTRLPNHIIVS